MRAWGLGLSCVLLAAWSAGLAAQTGPSRPPATLRGVEVLAAIALPPAERRGLTVAELSALAWDEQRSTMWAASDKGRLFGYTLLHDAKGVLLAADLALAWPLMDAASQRRLNAEALGTGPRTCDPAAARLAVPTSGCRLIVGAEHARTAHCLEPGSDDSVPLTLTELAWPAGLDAERGDVALRHGVEALAWVPGAGLLATLQRPVAPAGPHLLHGPEGMRLWWPQDEGGRSDVKAIEWMPPGRLLMLQRVRGAERRSFVLREVELSGCNSGQRCDGVAVPVSSPKLSGQENLEGLACRAGDLCYLVSDNGGPEASRTVLLQVRLLR
jgi:hypothetical protein